MFPKQNNKKNPKKKTRKNKQKTIILTKAGMRALFYVSKFHFIYVLPVSKKNPTCLFC